MPSSQLVGMSQHIKRLEEIAEKCGEKKKKQEETKDGFVKTKANMYRMLEVLRENIRNRQAIQKAHGNCVEAIEKGVRIREQLAALDSMLPKLQEIHKKQANKTRTFTREEIGARYQDIRMLKRHIDEARSVFLGNGDEESGLAPLPDVDGLEKGPRATLFGNASGLRDAARVDTQRDLNDEEAGAMARFKNRDDQFDAMLDEISLTIDRLNPLAQQIGQTAQRQQLLAEDITESADKAEDDLRQMNVRLHQVMEYEKGTTFFCRMILICTLLGMGGFVFNQLKM